MAAENFEPALRRLLAHEGGYADHPSDPGGPTKYGITLATYRGVKPDATAADVRAMTEAEARAIYRVRYWTAARCDELPAGLDYAVFDYAVNSGTGRAAGVLRRLLALPAGQTIDTAVVAAANARPAADLVAALCDERLAFLKRLSTWPTFGKGWGRRVAEVRSAALVMAGQRAPLSPVGGAVAGAAAATAAGGAAVAVQPDAAPLIVAFALLFVAVLGVAIWLVWRKRKREAAHG